jgi:putative transposase
MQVSARALIVGMGVNADGRRELLDLKGSDSESEAFWRQLIGSLKERGHSRESSS